MSLRVIQGGIDPNYALDTEKPLGEGGFGKVFKVRRKSDGKVLACKTIKVDDPKDTESIVQEVSALRKLAGCRNVARWMPDVVYDVEDKIMRLHMEYYPDGDLEKLIESHQGRSPVPKDTVTQVFCCLAMALLDCHSRGICHRDIKPANVLLSRKIWNSQPVTVAYLADFGIVEFSKVALTSGVLLLTDHIAGTMPYMAPESMDGIYSERSDLFSLGCTMYKLCNLQLAYEDYDRSSVPPMTRTATREYGDRLCPLIASLMQLSPALRPSTQQLVASLEAYCASRWEKQKATLLWQTLAVVSQVTDTPQHTAENRLPPQQSCAGMAAAPPFQLPEELRALQQPPPYQYHTPQQQQHQQQQQQQHRGMSFLPPGLQQARQAHQLHQQRVAALQQIQQRYQFPPNKPN
ncbi:hypothetical protein OQA88_11558 [Cercophora sp. LCS_1]